MWKRSSTLKTQSTPHSRPKVLLPGFLAFLLLVEAFREEHRLPLEICGFEQVHLVKVTPRAQTRDRSAAAMHGVHQSLSQGVSVNLCDVSLSKNCPEVFFDIGSFRQSQVRRLELSWLRLLKSTLSESLGDDHLFHLRLRREDDGPAVERTVPRDSDVEK